ncbi:APG9-domain-containing protein [Suhomyces tanzawaensis NRRL Y-17324]|uniref:Autophagy-related protein 9 n=1 Tax=Suhomyces tanzawaensis NRRL Y-17324 TaxID=984487 RepID=A0A1E4SC25_9ASCO|nr:APG9-domain-containing protein [Suhomyces tanzawaensis NRRL Y-17324]ODV77067.1 APG9-domain-containing protein [Suhomyces tanzawaensis NRRL Y-17324]
MINNNATELMLEMKRSIGHVTAIKTIIFTNPPHNSASATNDTFLSRVFGLHSVYNQLHDNYQFYDPDLENSPSRLEDDGPNPVPIQPESVLLAPTATNNTLLDSESDLDLSLSPSASGSPKLNATDSVKTRKKTHAGLPPGHINWNVGQAALHDDHNSDEDDLLTSLNRPSPPKPRKLTFNIPNPRNYFHKSREPPLPLFNTAPGATLASSYRKPVPKEPVAPTNTELFQRKRPQKFVVPPKERALYLWANIMNMDEFLTDIYYYYRGKGLLNIVVTRVVDLVILVFVLYFSIFLKWGINYQIFYDNYKTKTQITLGDLIIPHFIINEVPWGVKLLLLGFFGYIVLRLIQLYFDYNYKLREIRNFYIHLIGIANDNELMTISWKTIVERLMLLKDYNSLTSTNEPSNPDHHYHSDLKSKVRLNAHDIANRIMRKENYFIALINKEVLDLSLNLPFKSILVINSKSILTKTLEWNLKLCINNFIFNPQGQINPNILKEHNRNQLSRELNSRFKMAAIINLILSPFIVIYFVLLYFFRYFNEYKSNPSSLLGLRQYTPFAHWKLREFNELPHFFIRRLHLSVGPANTYINQFPRGFIVVNLMYLVNFILGSIMAILVIMGLWFEDEEHSFWSFEITEGKSSLFYISFFGTVWAITSTSMDSPSSSTNSSENANTNTSSFVYDPEASLRYVSQFTHYLPSSWNGRLHTMGVKNEFCELYSLKIVIIVNEILSLILTPFILWFKVLNNSGAVIDFFRDFSIHVDGLGYVCYFAMFNFEEKDKNMMYDLNKKKPHRHRYSSKSKIATTKSNRQVTPGEIELENIRPNRNEKAKISDSEASDSDEVASDTGLNNDYYQDDKMIKSYMYFLESYGGTNANARVTPPESKPVARKYLAPTPLQAAKIGEDVNHQALHSQFDPSPSLIYPGQGNANSLLSHSLSESTYNINYKFEELDQNEYHKGKKSGVLGMLNQFYKQDINR